MAETANHAGQRIVNAQPTGAFQHILVDFQQAQPLQIARAVIVKDSLDALPLQDAQIVRAVLLPGIALRRAQMSLQLLGRARYKIEAAKIQILQRQLIGIVRAIHAVIGLGLQLRKLLQFGLSFAKGHGLILHQYLNGGDHIVLQGIHGIAYIHLIALCGIDGMLYYLRAGTIAQQAARIDRAGQLTGDVKHRLIMRAGQGRIIQRISSQQLLQRITGLEAAHIRQRVFGGRNFNPVDHRRVGQRVLIAVQRKSIVIQLIHAVFFIYRQRFGGHGAGRLHQLVPQINQFVLAQHRGFLSQRAGGKQAQDHGDQQRNDFFHFIFLSFQYSVTPCGVTMA